MEIKFEPLGDIKTNCYMISGESGVAVIDPGFESEKVLDFLKNNSDKERMIILTHNHFDHSGYALKLSRLTDTKIAIGEYDNEGLSNPFFNLCGMFSENMESFSADILLKDGDILKLGDLEFEVIHTPGHTKGGIGLLSGDKLFSGDTLFYESIGRTDFPSGSYEMLKSSVLKLLGLGDNITVYSGHGPFTTIAHEKHFNPYIEQE